MNPAENHNITMANLIVAQLAEFFQQCEDCDDASMDPDDEDFYEDLDCPDGHD
jgi:hypothetical protein